MSGEPLYIDTSALVKLVVTEQESTELIAFLAGHTLRVTSDLSTVEMVRAARRYGYDAITATELLLDTMFLLHIDRAILDTAARLDPLELRTLDAIHLASALSLGSDLGMIVTYDSQMKKAAQALHLSVVAPGQQSD